MTQLFRVFSNLFNTNFINFNKNNKWHEPGPSLLWNLSRKIRKTFRTILITSLKKNRSINWPEGWFCQILTSTHPQSSRLMWLKTDLVVNRTSTFLTEKALSWQEPQKIKCFSNLNMRSLSSSTKLTLKVIVMTLILTIPICSWMIVMSSRSQEKFKTQKTKRP